MGSASTVNLGAKGELMKLDVTPLSIASALALVLGGCVGGARVEGAPCPCADGYTCCTSTNLCVELPSSCALPRDRTFTRYTGGFECDDFDADAAMLFIAGDGSTAWMGWVPSNIGDSTTHVLRRVAGPSFSAAFFDVDGADAAREAESVTLALNLTPGQSSDLMGTGTLTRGDQTVESCEASFADPTGDYLEFQSTSDCFGLFGGEVILLLHEVSNSGVLAFVPAHGPTDRFVATGVSGLAFSVAFSNVWGLQSPDTPDDLTLAGDLHFAGAETLTGSFTVVAPSSGQGSCEMTFERTP